MAVLGSLTAMSCSSGETTATVSSTPVSTPDTMGNEQPELIKVAFDTDSAMHYLGRQVEFGPRVPGTAAHKQCADWLAATLRSMGAQVADATLQSAHPSTGKNIAVRNIFAQFNPAAADRIIVVAHYDTRPWADEDPDPSNHSRPIDGANDGASGVAVALELARLNKALTAGRGLDILLVDQEDSGTHNDDESWCLGSALWARDLPYTAGNRPRFGILLDMVGGRDAVFLREYFSEMYASGVNDLIWSTASSSGHADRFVNRQGGAINDDHLSLLRAGIPTVDIIEMRVDGTSGGFNPTWHTMADNIDNIDPATIGAAGEVITNVIYPSHSAK